GRLRERSARGHGRVPALVRQEARAARRLRRRRFLRHVRIRLAGGGPAATSGPAGPRGGRKVMNDAELREAIVSAAYLEGDFVLRSGKRSRYYLDKFRFETQPDILAALGDRIAGAVGEHE